MARTRTFLALDLGDAIRKKAAALQKVLARTGADVKWVPTQAMHVTLLFLGELSDTDLAKVCRVTAKAAATVNAFSLQIAGVGAFPNLRRPKVLWAGVGEGTPEIQALFAALEMPLAEQGIYRKEDRPYAPHLTLGRVNDEAGGQAMAAELAHHTDWAAGIAFVESVHIMASEMRREGPEYTVIGRAGLDAGSE